MANAAIKQPEAPKQKVNRSGHAQSKPKKIASANEYERNENGTLKPGSYEIIQTVGDEELKTVITHN